MLRFGRAGGWRGVSTASSRRALHPFYFSCNHSALLFTRGVVLVVGDAFEPVDDLAVQLFLDGEVRHRGAGHRAVPVLFARRAPHYVAVPDHFDRPAPALHATVTGGHDQRLAERMRVPVAARAGLEGDVRAA